MARIPQLKQKYNEEIVPQIMNENGFKSQMRVARLQKVVLNISLGEAIQNPRAVEAAVADLTLISGQKPVTTKARKAVASFKLREGMTIGVMVTLRGKRMYDFLERLINAALPRTRDFQGVPRDSFDGRGNYALGIKEQILFPEIDYDKIDKVRGMQVNIVTSAPSDEEGRRLLELMGMPFVRG
ncbi:MAG: 50S ribosomal protein L5 [Chloroflexi bacterium]|jgi:large subunit ribosomal protein L5|nr:50S ribosomal protein L5 [Chloroflexota bacterium]